MERSSFTDELNSTQTSVYNQEIMKAAVLQSLGNMEFTEVEDPKCEPEGLVVKVMASAICGTDLKIYRHGHAWITLPWILGHENAGVVAEIGSGVTGWEVGDRVAVGCIMPCNNCLG